MYLTQTRDACLEVRITGEDPLPWTLPYLHVHLNNLPDTQWDRHHSRLLLMTTLIFNTARDLDNLSGLTVFSRHLRHHLPPADHLLFLPCQKGWPCWVKKICCPRRSWNWRLSHCLFCPCLLGPSHRFHERRMKAGYNLLSVGRGSPKLCFQTLKTATHTNTSYC